MQSASETNLKEGYIFRPPTLDDVEAVVGMVNACSLKTIGQADESVEDVRGQWQSPDANLERDQRVVITPDGRMIGYAHVDASKRPTAPFVDVYLHPDDWGDPVADFLMQWVEERAQKALADPTVPADARAVMQAATYAADLYYKRLLESAGMHICRVQWRMQIDFDAEPPPPQWPSGIVVRSVRPDEDLRPILRVLRDAWQDHWGYEERPFKEHYASWLHDWDEGRFDRSLWFVAMDGDEIAGVSLCKPRFAEDEDLGWVNTLGVIRAYRKQGLGMALLLHSFNELHQRGKPRVGLGVDGGSLTGATRLYQRAGMRVVIQVEVYEKELRPGVSYRVGGE